MTPPHSPHTTTHTTTDTTAVSGEAVRERPVFYTLPAHLVAPGMSTREGHTVVATVPPDATGWLVYTIARPGHDPAPRHAPRYRRVDLAVFHDTTTDGSALPEAVVEPPTDPAHDDIPF